MQQRACQIVKNWVLVVGLDFLQERSSVQLIIYATKIKKLNCTCGTGREREGLAVAAI